MSSLALHDWRTRLASELDQLEAIHRSATGAGAGRRWGTAQFNGQLFVALVGQFQNFARSLHDESLDWLRAQGPVASVLADLAAKRRRLDVGNPSPPSLAEDFGRLGLKLESAVAQRSRHGGTRWTRLERAVRLRNGIAHADPSQRSKAEQGTATERAVPTLASYRTHRSALHGLAVDMDVVVAHHLGTLCGTPPPW